MRHPGRLVHAVQTFASESLMIMSQVLQSRQTGYPTDLTHRRGEVVQWTLPWSIPQFLELAGRTVRQLRQLGYCTDGKCVTTVRASAVQAPGANDFPPVRGMRSIAEHLDLHSQENFCDCVCGTKHRNRARRTIGCTAVKAGSCMAVISREAGLQSLGQDMPGRNAMAGGQYSWQVL